MRTYWVYKTNMEGEITTVCSATNIFNFISHKLRDDLYHVECVEAEISFNTELENMKHDAEYYLCANYLVAKQVGEAPFPIRPTYDAYGYLPKDAFQVVFPPKGWDLDTDSSE